MPFKRIQSQDPIGRENATTMFELACQKLPALGASYATLNEDKFWLHLPARNTEAGDEQSDASRCIAPFRRATSERGVKCRSRSSPSRRGHETTSGSRSSRI